MPEDTRKTAQAEPKRGSREPDDFWDVEHLLPDRPTGRTSARPRPVPTAVEVELSPRAPMSSSDTRPPAAPAVYDVPLTKASSPATSTAQTAELPVSHTETTSPRTEAPTTVHYVPPHTAEEAAGEPPLVEYEPDGVLLHRVRVFGWRANYHYFDQFAKDAVQYAAMEAPAEARRESFFSYFPQYVQLNRRRAAWYLWWRERVRAGEYPDTDYAYVLLYLFELINLPAEDDETARRYRDDMAGVWMAYRRVYPQLDQYMCEWLCDYCLIHRLNAPVDRLALALDDIIQGSRLKEFYLFAVVGGEGHDMETARILLRHCCQYDYRKSKFAQGEHKALFDRTIPAAVASVLSLILGRDGQPPVITMLDSTVTRDAYTGALCSYRNKRRIEVSYTSFSRSHELRFLIGDMVKHIENRLRAWIGVRSRLSVMSLPIPLRDALDAYLAPLAPSRSAVPVKKKEQPRPTYEALYDRPQKPLSLADAAAIEAVSWETTRILTEAFGGEAAPDEWPEALTAAEQPASSAPTAFVAQTTPTPTAPVAQTAPLDSAPSDTPPAPPADGAPTVPMPTGAMPHAAFLLAALNGDPAAQRAAAADTRRLPDAIADEINGYALDSTVGDIILEDDGTGFYGVVEDYREAVWALYRGS